MGKNSLRVEWTFPADEQDWPTLPPMPNRRDSTPAEPFPTTAHHAERRLAALIVALALLSAGVRVYHRQLQAATLVVQLQTAVAAEAAAAPAADTPSRPNAQLVDEQFIRGDLVMAQVTVRDPADGDAPAYRETRFYRRTAEGWQRTTPDPTWLGPVQTLETAHFTIHYRDADAAAVAEVAPRLDRLNEKLRRDFGLPVAISRPDIVVEVLTDEQRHRFHYVNRTLAVPSPAVLSVPVEISPATAIYQPIVYPLAVMVMTEVVEQYRTSWKRGAVYWEPLLGALPLWAVWEEEGPLAAGQADVVRWLYHNAQATTPAARQAMPVGYEQLCRAYRVWGLSPLEMSIPLACSERFDQRSPWAYPAFQLRLEGLLNYQSDPSDEPPPRPPFGQTVAMATVVDYVVATYGRERLAYWLAALGDHTDWQSLAPAVFGVSAAEFEAGWHAYLAEKYGTSEIR